MGTRSMIATLSVALAAAGFASIGQAASVDVDIGIAPPPPPATVEVVPPAREGYIYERAHYGWDTAAGVLWENLRHLGTNARAAAATPGTVARST